MTTTIAQPRLSGGVNIAMKVPAGRYDETVRFYRDVLGFPVRETDTGTPSVARTHRVEFGPNVLWLDLVEGIERPELFLEIRSTDVERTTNDLLAEGIRTEDELEDLGEVDTPVHWIRDPAGTVLLLAERPLVDGPVGE